MNDGHNTHRKAWTMGVAADRRTCGHPELRALPSHPSGESWIFFNGLFMDQFSEMETNQEKSPRSSTSMHACMSKDMYTHTHTEACARAHTQVPVYTCTRMLKYQGISWALSFFQT